MNPQLISLAITMTPSIVQGIKDLFRRQNPDQPTPTEADVLAAFEAAFQSSIAKDEAWLAAHPE